MTYNSIYLNQKIENALWIDATSASFRMPKKNQFARDQNFQYNIVAGFYTLFNSFMTGRHHIQTSPLICSGNQWIGFYMITASIMKELRRDTTNVKPSQG